MKFKEGDLVQVVPDYALNKRYSGIIIQPFMYPLLKKGKPYTISTICADGSLYLNEVSYCWGIDTFTSYITKQYNKHLN